MKICPNCGLQNTDDCVACAACGKSLVCCQNNGQGNMGQSGFCNDCSNQRNKSGPYNYNGQSNYNNQSNYNSNAAYNGGYCSNNYNTGSYNAGSCNTNQYNQYTNLNGGNYNNESSSNDGGALSIVAIVLAIFMPIAGLILGIVGMSNYKNSPNIGKFKAAIIIASIILGVQIISAVLYWVFTIGFIGSALYYY